MRAHRQARRPAVDRDDDRAASPGRASPVDGQPAAVAAVLRLQRTAGNAAVTDMLNVSRDDDDRPMPAEFAPFRSTARAAPRDEAPVAGDARHYNERVRHGRALDTEGASGVLPWTPPSGWNGELIARRLSQLNIAVPRTDAVECVEVAFIVGLVLEGPSAVREAMGHYLTRYRKMLATRGVARGVRRQLVYGSAHLEDAIRAIDEMTLTYADLAQLATAMFRVHAHENPRRGTNAAEEAFMAEEEGFQSEWLGIEPASQETVARLAAALQPRQYISCRIDATEPGTGETNHAVRIGRNAHGELYLYDPWPRRGTQYQIVDQNLDAIGDYFVTTVRGEDAPRRWLVLARWTPPTAH